MPKPLTFAELGIECDAAYWRNWVKRMKYGTVPDRTQNSGWLIPLAVRTGTVTMAAIWPSGNTTTASASWRTDKPFPLVAIGCVGGCGSSPACERRAGRASAEESETDAPNT